VKKLFDTIAPWYNGEERRLHQIHAREAPVGDGSEICILELVKSKEQLEEERKQRTEKREAKLRAKEEKRKLERAAAMEEARTAEGEKGTQGVLRPA